MQTQKSGPAMAAGLVRGLSDSDLAALVREASGPIGKRVLADVGSMMLGAAEYVAGVTIAKPADPAAKKGPSKSAGAPRKRANPPSGGGTQGAAKAQSEMAKPAAKAAGQKRSPADLAALQEKVVAFVGACESAGVEQIGKRLGVPTKTLALPIKALVASGRLATTGQKRATRYSAAAGKQASASNGATAHAVS